MFGRNKKNVLVLVQKIGKQYVEIDRIKYKKGEELVNNKKHSIPIPPKNPYAFSSGKTKYTFFDIGEKEYINFETTELGLSTEFLEELFNRRIVGQLVKAVKKAIEEPKTNTDIIKQIMLYGGLVLVGYLLGIQFGCG